MANKSLPLALLDGFRLECLERQLRVRQIHVYAEDRGSVEYDLVPARRENLYSGSKTYTAVAIGIARDQGSLALEDKLLDYFPEYREEAAEKMDHITVRDLLQMRSGKKHLLFRKHRLQTNEDYARLYLTEELDTEPGSEWFYSNLNTYMLGRVLEKATGKGPLDFLKESFFPALGIFHPQWQTCPNGHTLCATGLELNTEEYACLGRFLLQEGVWEGQPLLSRDFVRQMSHDLVPTPTDEDWAPHCDKGYGYQVWAGDRPESFRADGLYGQFSCVYPRERAVLTCTARSEDRAYDIITAMEREILPRLENL